MKQHLIGAALTLGMVGSMAMPSVTLASRNIIIARQQEQQVLTSISPADEDAQALLKDLNITLEASDPLWNDSNFIALVQKYKEIRALGLDIVGQIGELVLQAFDMVDIASQIDRAEFQAISPQTPEEKAQQEELKAYIRENIDALKADPDAFFEQILGNLPAPEQPYEFEHEEYDSQSPYAYGYADPYDAVEAGHVVWLFDDSYNPLSNEMTITWTQTSGPDVTWLNTTSDRDVAFIMPSLQGEGEDYLSFTVTADNGYAQTSYDVYVYWLAPYEGDLAEVYSEVMGREIDDFTFNYWDQLHYDGMSIEQIRAHFELMKQYESQA